VDRARDIGDKMAFAFSRVSKPSRFFFFCNQRLTHKKHVSKRGM